MIYHIVYIPVIYRLNMDETKTTEHGEPRINADIRNMEINLGMHNWDGSRTEGLTAGSITIRLPNGTRIDICSVLDDSDYSKAEIGIHQLNDTEITLFEKSSTITKRARKIEGVSMFTKIMKKVA